MTVVDLTSPVRIDALLIVQAAVTFLLIWFYAASVGLPIRTELSSGYRRNLLLADFVLRHRRPVVTLTELLGVPHGVDSNFVLQRARTRLDELRASGRVPRPEAPEPLWSTVLGVLLSILLAPLVVAVVSRDLTRRRRVIRALLRSTDQRREDVALGLALLLPNLGYLVLSTRLLGQAQAWWLGALLFLLVALCGAATLFGPVALLIAVREQAQWREFWEGELLDIMARAAHDGDHTLFNRAQLLSRDVATEPAVPIPGALGAYIFVFAAVQAVLIWVADQVNWL